jgi:hypothetical protein
VCLCRARPDGLVNAIAALAADGWLTDTIDSETLRTALTYSSVTTARKHASDVAAELSECCSLVAIRASCLTFRQDAGRALARILD